MSAERLAASPDAIGLLLVENNSDDHRLITDLLDAVAGARFTIDWAKDLSSGRDRLQHGRFDVCLIDQNLPDGRGLDLLESAALQGGGEPVIILSGQGEAKLDRQAMALGAAGFLDKTRLDPVLLDRTIRYAMEQRKTRGLQVQAAFKDEATGLITPALLHDRLARALTFAGRRQSLVATAIIDIGGDEENGDLAFQEKRIAILGKRLIRHLRETDSVARLTDRHIALVLEELRCADDAALVAQKVWDRLVAPIMRNGEAFAAAPAIGIALYPEECGDVDGLLRKADEAMRRARSEDAHPIRFASERIDSTVRRRFLLSDELRRTLEQDGLTLRFRPLVHLADSAVGLSAEIAATSPGGKPMEAADFQSIAHDRRLTEALIDWIVRRAVTQLQAWRDQGFDRIDLALPAISRRASDLPMLERSLRRHLGSSPIDPDHVEIDLDQDVVVDDLASGGHGLAMLEAIGVRLALDDFGRKETSLQNVASDRLDSLKLSPRLYEDLPDDGARDVLLKSVINLGHDLDLRVVANGAGDERQFAFLKKAGVDAIKLGGAGSSLSADMFTDWLRKIQRRERTKDHAAARTDRPCAPSPIERTTAEQPQPSVETH